MFDRYAFAEASNVGVCSDLFILVYSIRFLKLPLLGGDSEIMTALSVMISQGWVYVRDTQLVQVCNLYLNAAQVINLREC